MNDLPLGCLLSDIEPPNITPEEQEQLEMERAEWKVSVALEDRV